MRASSRGRHPAPAFLWACGFERKRGAKERDARARTRTHDTRHTHPSQQDVFVPSPGLKAALTFGLRFANTWVGGLQWMWYAKYVGVQ